MRHFLMVLLITLTSIPAFAKCANSGIYLLSNNHVLNKNGLIILQFYGSSQSLVPELNKNYPVYLKSGKSLVSLLPVEILKGEFELTQVILKPSAELVENKTYELTIDKLPEYEKNPKRYNALTQLWEKPDFTILNTTDIEIPVLQRITELKKTMVSYGCGPAKWVYFNITAQDRSTLFVRASVKSKLTNLTTTYILPVENGLVKIGHGMCSGAFHFDSGDSYEVTFSLMDESGNRSEPTKPMSFNSPKKETNEE